MDDPNAGLSFHYYCVWASVTGAGCDQLAEQVFGSAEAYAQRTGAALLLTEFGATDDLRQIDAVVDRAAAHGTGWQYWAYCGCADPTTTDQAAQGLVGDPFVPPTGANVDADKLFALAVPHPKAVAGVPVSSQLDRATGAYELTYRTARADGAGEFAPGSVSTVTIPRVRYPAGYAVEVHGASVDSPPDAGVLELRSLPGAGEVTVRVTPRRDTPQGP
jgi:endoglycosylceramidase